MKIAMIALAGLAGVASAQSADVFNGQVGVYRPNAGHRVYSGMVNTDAVLWDNGPLSTGATSSGGAAAPAGFTWSEVQSPNTTAGFTANGTFRLADDFTIPAGQSWSIDGFDTFGYQTGSAAGTQPMTGGTLNVWNGVPGAPGSSIVGTATYGSAANTSLYRIFNNTPGTTRLVREADWTAALNLGPGTYWVDFNYTVASGSLFVPSVTIPGQPGNASWNGLQFNGTAWVAAIDTGGANQQDFAFRVNGTIIPAPASLALVGLGGLVAGRRRR